MIGITELNNLARNQIMLTDKQKKIILDAMRDSCEQVNIEIVDKIANILNQNKHSETRIPIAGYIDSNGKSVTTHYSDVPTQNRENNECSHPAGELISSTQGFVCKLCGQVA